MESDLGLSRALADVTMLLIEVIKQEFRLSAGKDAPTLTQFKMLYSIKDGIGQVGRLAGIFGMSQPAASKMVEGLVKDGLLKRFPHPDDRRKIELRLTPKASASMEKMYKRAYVKIDARLESYPEAKKKNLVKHLREVKDILSAASSILPVLLGVLVGGLPLVRGARADVPSVSLDQYLGQVQGSNDGYTGAATIDRADRAAAGEGELPFATQLYGNYLYTDDQRLTQVPIFEGTRTVTNASQLGFKKLFDFGLQSSLYYGVTQTSLYGVSPSLVPQASFVTSGLTLQLTQSLWQNGFGRSDEATRRAVEAQDLANAYTSAYQTKTILSDAESRYWALVVAREIVAIQKESADHTDTIRDFNAKRARSHLIDEADLLTSDAQARSAQFDLKTAIDNERVAARAFNSARGMDSDVVGEALAPLDPEVVAQIVAPTRAGTRDDVKAAEQSERAATANSEVFIEHQKPALNLVGTVSTNGLDPAFGNSVHDTWTTQYPYYSVGVNFSVPLDGGAVASVKDGYAAQMKGAELTYRRRLFDQENDWKDLNRKFLEAKERLSLAVDVERAQKLKFQRETTRQKQGLTTTYQVFQYDLDYLNAELNRVQTQAVILNLVAQMKTYRSSP